MDLPNFNPDGTGPQGTGGVPLESIREGLTGDAAMLAGSTLKPEDTPLAQGVFKAEAEQLLAAQGLIPEPSQTTPTSQPPTTNAGTAPTSVAPPTPSEPSAPGPTAGTSSDLAARIEALRRKYGEGETGLERLGKAYLNVQAAGTQAVQERDRTIEALRSEVRDLTTAIQGNRIPQPTQAATSYPPSPAAPSPTPQQANADFFQNPDAVLDTRFREFEQRIEGAIQRNLMAFRNAEQTVSAQQRAQKFASDNQADMSRLGGVMDELYSRRRAFYDAMPPDQFIENLLDDARTRDLAARGVQLYQELPSIINGTAAPAAPTLGASIPHAGSATRATQTAPNGDWSRTPSVQRLWRSRDGSTEETSALVDILRERGFADHIK